MSFWKQWVDRPQNLWIRRALFQVHLWTGIAIGLYVLVISVTGSAIVFRNEVYQSAPSGPRIVPVGEKHLTQAEIKQIALRAFPGHTISFVWEGKRADQAT